MHLSRQGLMYQVVELFTVLMMTDEEYFSCFISKKSKYMQRNKGHPNTDEKLESQRRILRASEPNSDRKKKDSEMIVGG